MGWLTLVEDLVEATQATAFFRRRALVHRRCAGADLAQGVRLIAISANCLTR